MSEYWEECINEAFADIGIIADDKQIAEMVDWVKGAHENYGMAHGHDCIPNPLENENKDLKKKLKDEQDKITCPACNGRGIDISYGGTFQATSQCFKCKGEGRILP